MKFKFLLSIIFLLIASVFFSQTFKWDSTEQKAVRVKKPKTDSVLKGNRHVIGIGAQFIPGNNRREQGHESSLKYNFPQLNIFYRYQLLMQRRIHAFNLAATQWHAHYIDKFTGKTGHSLKDVELVVSAIDVGYTHLWRFTKSKNSCLGLAGNAMFQFRNGTDLETGGYFNTGNGIYQTYEITNYVEEFHIWPTFNIEFNQRIPLKNKSFIMLGFKSEIIGRNVFYLAYNFKR